MFGRLTAFGMLLVALLFPGGVYTSSQLRSDLRAPTYYVVITADKCTEREVFVRGVSNLPSGAVLQLGVSEFLGDGWKDYSDPVNATIDVKGQFRMVLHPKAGMRFRRNLVATATFFPHGGNQPRDVIKIVGRKGEALLQNDNPQAMTVSGENSILETITRVGRCSV